MRPSHKFGWWPDDQHGLGDYNEMRSVIGFRPGPWRGESGAHKRFCHDCGIRNLPGKLRYPEGLSLVMIAST